MQAQRTGSTGFTSSIFTYCRRPYEFDKEVITLLQFHTLLPHHNFQLFVGQLLVYVLRLDVDWEIDYQISLNKATL